MSTQLGVARLIDDAFKLFDLASAQLGEGKLSAASNLLGKASRTIEQAQGAAHPALGYGHGAQTIMHTARVRAEAAQSLIRVGDVHPSEKIINSAKSALDFLRPG